MNPIRRFALSWLPIASAFTALSARPSVPAAGVQGATPLKPLAVRLELVPKSLGGRSSLLTQIPASISTGSGGEPARSRAWPPGPADRCRS